MVKIRRYKGLLLVLLQKEFQAYYYAKGNSKWHAFGHTSFYVGSDYKNDCIELDDLTAEEQGWVYSLLLTV